MKKIVIVFGTRPEAIKMAPIVKILEQDKSIQCKTIVTAQHRELLDQVLELFNITPDHDMDLMKSGQDLFDISLKVIGGLKLIFESFKPNLVLVHGDTTTSSMAALSAFYAKIPIGHIEAGLRTYNLMSPWPEEANRQITGRLSEFHFAPTGTNKQNLLNEGIDKNKVFVTGNTVIDALMFVLDKIKNDNFFKSTILDRLETFGLPNKIFNKNNKFILITGHRRENFGDGFYEICNAIRLLSIKYSKVNFIYPMHFNPNIREPIKGVFGNEIDRKQKFPNIYFIEPLNYQDFIYIMSSSYIILTDSGGIQEEAPSLGKPVLVMRDTTERSEALSAGTVKLVGTNSTNIINEVSNLLSNDDIYQKMSKAINPYGDGTSSKKIIEIIKKKLN